MLILKHDARECGGVHCPNRRHWLWLKHPTCYNNIQLQSAYLFQFAQTGRSVMTIISWSIQTAASHTIYLLALPWAYLCLLRGLTPYVPGALELVLQKPVEGCRIFNSCICGTLQEPSCAEHQCQYARAYPSPQCLCKRPEDYRKGSARGTDPAGGSLSARACSKHPRTVCLTEGEVLGAG
jgi:hypothetical protein